MDLSLIGNKILISTGTFIGKRMFAKFSKEFKKKHYPFKHENLTIELDEIYFLRKGKYYHFSFKLKNSTLYDIIITGIKIKFKVKNGERFSPTKEVFMEILKYDSTSNFEFENFFTYHDNEVIEKLDKDLYQAEFECEVLGITELDTMRALFRKNVSLVIS